MLTVLSMHSCETRCYSSTLVTAAALPVHPAKGQPHAGPALCPCTLCLDCLLLCVPPQVRAEVLCAVLAAVCVVVPEIEERLKEALPGRGRQGTSASVEGATQGFFLAPSLPDATKQELAWASYSLIKNTNSCGVVVVSGGEVVMARGALGQSTVIGKDAAQSLAAMSQVGMQVYCTD